jgi:hypothetical protein
LLLFEDPARREILAQNARRDAQNYSWRERERKALNAFPD